MDKLLQIEIFDDLGEKVCKFLCLDMFQILIEHEKIA